MRQAENTYHPQQQRTNRLNHFSSMVESFAKRFLKKIYKSNKKLILLFSKDTLHLCESNSEVIYNATEFFYLK